MAAASRGSVAAARSYRTAQNASETAAGVLVLVETMGILMHMLYIANTYPHLLTLVIR
jgi:hypothetical protein